MDVQTPTSKLQERVTCSVCTKVYTKPKELPCTHVFCLDCLVNCESEGENTDEMQVNLKCPLCKIEVELPNVGSFATMPDCSLVKNVIDMMALKEGSVPSVPCGNCDEKSEEGRFCFNCNKIWCQHCLKAHNALKENMKHRVLPIRQFQDTDFEDVLKLSTPPSHHPRVLAEQTQNCNQDITATEEINDIASRLTAAKQSLDEISKCIQRLEETSRLLHYRSRVNKEQMIASVQSLVSSLRVKEREALNDEEKTTKKAQEELRKQIVELRESLRKREGIVSQIDCLVQRREGAELVQSISLVDELFANLPDAQNLGLPTLATDWKTVTTFVENKQISESLQQSGIGCISTKRTTTDANQCTVKWFETAKAGLEAQIEVTTRNSEGEQCYCPGDYFTVLLISAQDRNIAIETKIGDKKNGNFVISFVPTQAGEYSPIVQVNGDTIRSFSSVKIRERSFALVGCLKSFKLPWGIATNSWNHIMITEMANDCITVLNEKGDLLGSFGKGVLKKPTGICIDEKDRIYVANRGNNKIILFGPRGEYITAIHNGDSLNEPRGIFLDTQGNLVVCDTGNQCIQVMSPNGSLLRTIGKGGLRKPVDCLCHEGKVFVSDNHFHLVKVYNIADGRFLYEFGRNETVDAELNEPTGVALDKTGNILICCGGTSNKPHRVHVYTLDGQLMRIFGSNLCGEELGQFNLPCAVTVLQNGRIVICDFKNWRLQIFE